MSGARADARVSGPISGVWTAIATPFRDDLEIDWDAFDKLLALQEGGGVAGVVIAGTTGESPTLTVQEKLSLVRRARASLGRGVRVMAGTGDNNTRHSVELSRLAEDAGADSLLVVTPPYNKPSLAGLENHYQSIAKAVSIPICVYHVPSRTAQHLQVDQLAALCRVAGVGAVKEASADVAYFSRALMRSGGVPYLSGDDSVYLGTLAVGGHGVISVVSNVFPRAMVELTAAYGRGDVGRAQALHEALLPMIDALFCEVNPCPLKAALAHRGLGRDAVRPPLAPVTDASRERVRAATDSAAGRLRGARRMKVWIHGASGRMGEELKRALLRQADMTLAGGSDEARTPEPKAAELILDFSTPEGSARLLAALRGAAGLARRSVVIGTTGIAADLLADWRALPAERGHAVLIAPNTSVGVLVTARAAQSLARALSGLHYDIEIAETHHRAKKDAPSGTAKFLAEAIRGGVPALVPAFNRAGARQPAEIGISATRGGGVFGEHEVRLIGDADEVRLTHRAFSRQLFADGALVLGRWLARQAPGAYGLLDVDPEALMSR